MNLRRAQFVVLGCLLSGAWGVAHSQNTSAPAAANQDSPAVSDPEDAYLSSTCYSNAHFGFAIDFPPDARLKPIPLPASMDRRIQLLDMVGPSPAHAVISISAFEYKGKNWTDAKGILRRELDQDLYTGVEELHGLSKTTIGGRQFYYFETRKGVTQHVELSAELNGYVLLAVLQANDPKMLKDLTSAFYQLKFFAPAEARQHAGPEATAYDGPAVSLQRLRELRGAPPAARMDPGKIAGNVYHNGQIGFLYEFPKGWSVQSEGAVEQAVERYRDGVLDEPSMGPREREVVKACRRTLLSVGKSKPGADGQVPYDDFGEITLSAMPLSCFPNLRFPDDPKDADSVRRFLVGYSFTNPLQRDMRDARSFEAGGQTFVLTNGTIAYKVDGDALSRRISVAMALTQHRGYLLVWLFAAPHDAELRELMNAKVGFDPDRKSKQATMTKAAGGEAPPESGAQTASDQTVANDKLSIASGPSATTAPGTVVAPTPATNAATPRAATTPTPGSSDAYRPTLLRDGEDMQSEQVQGAPIPTKKPN